MSKFLVPFVLLAHLFHGCSAQTSYQRMVDRVSSSVVHITGFKPDIGDGSDYSCSGFVLQKDLVLTDQHCLGERMYVDGVVAKRVKEDEYYDLALLATSTSKPALIFADVKPARFEDLTAIGFAFGWSKLVVLSERVLLIDRAVTKAAAPGLILQNGFAGGMSGGPIVNSDGEVVAIIQRSNEGLGYGVGTQIIKVFLLGDE